MSKNNFFIGLSKLYPISNFPFSASLASLLGILSIYVINNPALKIAFFTFLLSLSFISSKIIRKTEKDSDPKSFILDELLGAQLSVLFLSPNPYLYFLSFIVFRLLDIIKPFPIRLFEKKTSSYHFSIVLDDLLAGIITFLIIYTINTLK